MRCVYMPNFISLTHLSSLIAQTQLPLELATHFIFSPKQGIDVGAVDIYFDA